MQLGAQEVTTRYERFVPLFVPTENGVYQGALRVINHSSEQGNVSVYFIDDEGVQQGPASFELGKRASLLLYSDELSMGSDRVSVKGSPIVLRQETSLLLQSDINIEALAYVVDIDGHLTDLNATVASETGCWRVPFFLSKDSLVTSYLRLINRSTENLSVEIAGRDDVGQPSVGMASIEIPASSARWLTATELEEGASSIGGGLGSGSGDWQLALRSTQALTVIHLQKNTQGEWSNLSNRQVSARGHCWLGTSLDHADQSISTILQPYIENKSTPGLYAAIINTSGITSVAAVGVKKAGSSTPTSVHDPVHIGSITKPMTTLMVATLVDDEVLPNGWHTTIGEVFTNFREQIHEDFHMVSMVDLLMHNGGLPRDAEDWDAYPDSPIIERRQKIMLDNLSSPASSNRGSFSYSHFGYLVVAVMVEQLTGKTWETLMEERLFSPMGLDSAGFGAPATGGNEDEPWGHQLVQGEWQPTQTDRSSAYAPAGGIHLSMADLAKFAQQWFPESTPALLNRDDIDRILILGTQRQVAAGAVNVPGWFLYPNLFGHGIGLNHVGSNGRWHAQLWLLRDRNRAFLVVANSSDLVQGSLSQKTLPMLNDVIEELIKQPSMSGIRVTNPHIPLPVSH